MSVKLVRETRKSWPPQKRHRQKYFWNVNETAKIEHLNSCTKCFNWRLGIARKKAELAVTEHFGRLTYNFRTPRPSYLN